MMWQEDRLDYVEKCNRKLVEKMMMIMQVNPTISSIQDYAWIISTVVLRKCFGCLAFGILGIRILYANFNQYGNVMTLCWVLF